MISLEQLKARAEDIATKKKEPLLFSHFYDKRASELVKELGLDALIVGCIKTIDTQKIGEESYFPIAVRSIFSEGTQSQKFSAVTQDEPLFYQDMPVFDEDYAIDILVNGKPLAKKKVLNRSSPYYGNDVVEMHKGETYEICITSKKNSIAAVALLIDGKDSCYHKDPVLPETWNLVHVYPRQAQKWMLCNKLTVTGWQQGDTKARDFEITGGNEFLFAGGLSPWTQIGSITAYIYEARELPETLVQKGDSEESFLMTKEGKEKESKVKNVRVSIGQNKAILRVIYRTSHEIQIMDNQGAFHDK